MANEKPVILTSEGLQKYETRLELLKNEKRLEVAEKIKEARAFGDLSENAEYDAAKKEQAELEEEIAKIENILKNTQLLEDDEISTDIINIGSKVKIHDFEFKEDVDYQIVGSSEADPFSYKISNESPIGAGLIGHKKGETISIETPGGTQKFKILEIHK